MRFFAIDCLPKAARDLAAASVFLMVLMLASLVATSAIGAPKAELWERWTAHNPTSGRTVDHAIWDALTRRYVSRRTDGVAAVAYGRFSAPDKRALDEYLKTLASTPVSDLGRDEQMAYWLNLYNALTVKVILDHYPVRSIRDIDISPGLFANGPWGAKLIAVEGAELSLDDIEHRILRPIWKDPRIHYGVNCASIGCPDLKVGAYKAGTLETDLNAAAETYINHPRGAQVDRGRLLVSSIYTWFQDDFGGSDAGVIAHLKKYAAPGLQAELARIDRLYDDRYDWALNDPTLPATNDTSRRRYDTFNTRGRGGS